MVGSIVAAVGMPASADAPAPSKMTRAGPGAGANVTVAKRIYGTLNVRPPFAATYGVRLVRETNTQTNTQASVKLTPKAIVRRETLGKTMVGVTGFEPATPTSRT
jgi:hypothetical protein